MLLPDDLTQTTDSLDLDGQSTFSERRSQKQTTDLLPTLNETIPEAGDTKTTHRQILRLRQENKRLHIELERLRQETKRLYPELEALRSEKQQLIASLSTLQEEFDENVATIHSGHLQEAEHYEGHLRELMEEHNRLQATHLQLEQRYEELNHLFQNAVEEETRRRVMEAVHTLERSPEKVPPLLTDMVEILGIRTKQEEEQYLVEIFALKHEIKRLREQLEEEHRQLESERQQVVAMRQASNGHMKAHQTTLQARLYLRWTAIFASVTTGVLFLLVFLQFFFLGLFGIPRPPLLSLSLVAPIVICIIVAVLLAYPRSTMNRVRAGLPSKKVVKKEASAKEKKA